MMVRVEGLEPPCLAAPDPKSGASTNFAIPANIGLKPLILNGFALLWVPVLKKRCKDRMFFVISEIISRIFVFC